MAMGPTTVGVLDLGADRFGLGICDPRCEHLAPGKVRAARQRAKLRGPRRATGVEQRRPNDASMPRRRLVIITSSRCGSGRSPAVPSLAEEADQIGHRRIGRPANQGRGSALLNDQSGMDQTVQMMGERRGRDVDALLEGTDRQTVMARPDERTVHL